MELGFLPEVRILMANYDLKLISKVRIGDKVFSYPSHVREVQDVMSSKFSGVIFQIRCKGQIIKVECTGDQQFFVVKKEIRDYCRKRYSRMKINILEKNIESIKSKQLRKGDILIILKHPSTQKAQVIDTDNFIFTHSNYLRYELPKQLKLTKGLFRWFGYYLAEGMVMFTTNKTYEKKCRGVSFTFNINEKILCNDLISIGKSIFNLSPKIIDFPERNGKRLEFYSTQLGEFMYSLFNTGSSNKKIHPFLISAPDNLLKELIGAWLSGDGWICNSKYHKGRITGNTTSAHLARQIYYILLNQGELPTIGISAHKNQNRKKAREMGFYLRHTLYSITLPKNIELCHRKQNQIMVFTPIYEINFRKFNGFIYNFKIRDINSFQVNYYWVPGLAFV